MLAGILAVLLGRRGGVPRRPALFATGWAVLLAAASLRMLARTVGGRRSVPA